MSAYDGTTTQWLEDVELHTWPPEQRGGQSTGRYYFGVLAIHKPTGIAVVSTDERSQWRNREIAIEHLRQILQCETKHV